MDPVLAEIYSTVLQAAPFVIAAYASVFFIVLAYVVFSMTKFKRVEKRMEALEEHVNELRLKD